MSLQDQIASMLTAIEKLVNTTLSNIHQNLPDGNNDFVLADTDDNFKTFFLEMTKERIDYAYKSYVMQGKFNKLINAPNTKDVAKTPKALTLSSKEANGSTPVRSSDQPFPKTVSSDISPIEKNRQLQLQNELENTLSITGLPLRGGDQEWLLQLVRIMCEHILVPLDADDIENIRCNDRELLVTFHKKYLKEKVFIVLKREKKLRSDHLLRLLSGEMSSQIKVIHKATEFYSNLTFIANSYVNNKKLHCFRITNRGLGIMFTKRDSEFVYVQSEYELHEQVSRYILKRKLSKEVEFAV